MTPVPPPASSPAPPPYERYAAALSRLPAPERSAPLALLDLDAFRANAAALHARAGDVPIRVASKSLRIRRAVTEALGMPGFRGIMAFTLPEALWWAGLGQPDVLLAYPTADEAALARWIADPAARAAVTVTVDAPEHLALLARVAHDAGVPLDDAGLPPLRICLDVDAAWQAGTGRLPGLLRVGALRSPVRTPEQAAELARRVVGTPGMRLAGILAYEGQVAGVPEGTGTRAVVLRTMKRASVADLRTRRPAIVEAVRAVAREAGRTWSS